MYDKKIIASRILIAVISSVFVICYIFQHPIDLVFAGELLWNDDFDTNLIRWILEATFKALDSHHFENVWDANSFYPSLGTLAYSDAMLSLQIFYYPLRKFGLLPMQAIYGTIYILVFVSNFITTYALTSKYKFNSLNLLILLAIPYITLSFTNFLVHYQLFGMLFYVPYFIYVFRLLDGDVKSATPAALIFVFASMISAYFAPMAFAITIMLFVTYYKFDFKKYCHFFYCIFSNRATLIALVVIGSIFYIIFVRHYTSMSALKGGADYSESAIYSANIFSLLTSISDKSSIYEANPTYGFWESSYFPGYTILFSAILSLVILKRFRISEFYKRFYLYTFSIFICAYLLSLGPYLSFFDIKCPAPYYILSKIFPGLNNVRAPGRFGMFFGIFWAASLVCINQALTNYYSKILRYVVLALLTSIVLYESKIKFNVKEFDTEGYKKHSLFSSVIHYRDPILILPLGGKDNITTIRNIMNGLNISIESNGWPINGYGSRTTPMLDKYVDITNKYDSHNINYVELYNFAKSDGIKFIIMPCKSSTVLDISSTSSELILNNDYSCLIKI